MMIWMFSLIADWKDTHLERNALIGVSIMLVVAVANTIDTLIVRVLAGQVSPFFMAFTRAAFGLLAMLPWILRRPEILVTRRYGLHLLRAGLKLASLLLLFLALAQAPLVMVTAIGYAAPVFVSIGAWIVLRERPRALRILAVIIGFGGVLVLLNPRGASFEPALLFAFASALLLAAIQLMLKVMGARESSETLVAWNLIATVPIALIPAIWFWATPTPVEWALLALQGAIGAFNQLMVTRAFQYADASLIAPIDFIRLPLIAAAAWWAFGETVGMTAWIGSTIILVSTILMALSTRRISA